MDPAGSTDPIGVGIIGTGLSATMHVTALASVPRARVLAVAGTSVEKARAFAAKHDIGAAYGSVEELLRHPGIRAVHLCTPPFAHERNARLAAAAGLNVLVEKPMARTVEEADRIIAACRAAGVTLGAMFQFRFTPLPREIKRALDAGRIGRIFLADCYVKWWRAPEYYAGSSWRGTADKEGGAVLINQAIHTIDLLQWLAGPVASVAGRVATGFHRIEMEDVAVATLRFANGALGVVEASSATYPGFVERVELHGDRGSLILTQGQGTAEWHIKGEESVQLSRAEQKSGSSQDPANVTYAGHIAEFEDFYDALATGRAPAIDGAEGRKALEIVQAIQLSSAKGGAPVELPLR